MVKRILGIILSVMLVFTSVTPAFATEDVVSQDVALSEADAYEAVSDIQIEETAETESEEIKLEQEDTIVLSSDEEGSLDEVISIAQAREMTEGEEAIISGIVTYIIDDLAYIQDESGAIALAVSYLDAPQSGDVYNLTGTTSLTDGIVAFVPTEAVCINRGAELPVTQLVTIEELVQGAHQGELVRLENVYLEKITEDINLYIADKTSGEHIYVYQPAEFNGLITEDSYLDITAVVSIKDGAPVLRTMYENDIVFTDVPVEIYNEEGLNAMRNNMHYNYVLMDDITLENNWVCIGDNQKMYSGTFDGNNHTISNFNVVLDQEYQFMYAGFFGAIGGQGVVKNLTIEMTPETGAVRAYDQVDTSYAGAVAAYNNGVIENCHVKGTVSGNKYIGGITGFNSTYGTVKNCSFDGGIIATGSCSGGIVGYNKGVLQSPLNASVVSTDISSFFGGIAGYSSTDMDGFEAYVDIVASNGNIGGIVGKSAGCISNCYASGKITDGGSYTGGIVGEGDAYIYVENCESDVEINGASFSGGISGYCPTVKGSISHGNVTGLDMVGGISGSGNTDGCTSDSNVCGDEKVGGIVGTGRSDNCSYSGVYVKGNSCVGGIAGYSSGVANSDVANAGVTAAISYAGGVAGYNGGEIRNSYSYADVTAVKGYAGGLVGHNYRTNVYDSYSKGDVFANSDYASGLIGYHTDYNNNISNCYATGDVYTTGNYVGGIIGFADNKYRVNNADYYTHPVVTGCEYSGALDGAAYIGGIVGAMDEYYSTNYHYGMTIRNCYTDVEISGNSYLGGIAGNSYMLNMTESASNGTIEGSGDYIGGSVGYYRSNADYPLNDNYAIVSVKGNSYVGGFAGYVYANSFVERNYSAGNVSALYPAYSGGFIGINDGTNNVLRNYFDLETSGQSDDTKGVPKTTAQMRKASTYVAWDFDKIWEVVDNENNNYPQLRNTKSSENSPSDIYYVSNEAELRVFASKNTGICVITEDIVLTDNWTPFGNASTPFIGKIYGKGHTISNVIVDTTSSYAGFVGNMTYGEIYDLNIVGSVKGGDYTAGIVGCATTDSVISGCSFTGNVSGGNYVGGIAGNIAYDSEVSVCSFMGNISGSSYVGGVVGLLSSSKISDASANADISSIGNDVGGIAGTVEGSQIERSYAKGHIAATNNGTIRYNVGGIVGYTTTKFENSNGSTIYSDSTYTDCYSRMSISTSGNTSYFYVGGLSGDCANNSSNKNNIFTRCYHVGTAYKALQGTGSTPVYNACYGSASAEDDSFKDINKFVDWDFDSVWAIDSDTNDGYPYLKDVYIQPEEEIIYVSDEEDFNNIRSNLFGHYVLTEDIYLTQDWIPIPEFYGILDGNGFAVNNLNISSENNYTALFGMLKSAVVKNIDICTGLMGISGKLYTGTVAGYIWKSDIVNCNVYSSVRGTDYTGGIAGAVYGGNICKSSFVGDISGSSYVGGIVGILSMQDESKGGITDSSANADISSIGNDVGGIAGTVEGSQIERSYAKGHIAATNNGTSRYYVGGIVGYTTTEFSSSKYSNSTYTDCYSRMNISTSGNTSYFYVGGLSGDCANNSSNKNNIFTRCYHVGTAYKALQGYGSSPVYNACYASASAEDDSFKDINKFVDWDFDSVWTIDSDTNDGYPYLRSFSSIPVSVELVAEKTTLFVGDTLQLGVNIQPGDAPQLVSYASTDDSVVTVSAGGFVTAVKEGVAKVSVRAGNVYGVVTFTVLSGQEPTTIVSAVQIGDQELDHTSTYEDVLSALPMSAEVVLSNSSKVVLPVEWSLIEGSEYEFEGLILTDEGSPISNPGNIKAMCKIKVLDAPSNVAEVKKEELSVAFATSLDSVRAMLPQTVSVTLENGKTYQVYAVWSADSTPYYRSTTVGEYEFIGELVLPENGTILNPNGKVASAVVTVVEEPEKDRVITSVAASESIKVSFGTPLAQVRTLLPSQVNVVFDGLETLPLDVVWTNDSTPSYEPKIPGVYTFTGTITTDGNGHITNPYDIRPTISVVVLESETGERNMYVSTETASIGSTFDMTVSVDSASGMTSGSFVVDCDTTKLVPVAYEVGDAIGNASVMVNMNYTDPADGKSRIKVSFMCGEELNEGGNMVKLTFLVKSSVEDGETIPVSLKYVNVYDFEENPVAFNIVSGEVKAASFILGDTNGDGEVNILDGFRIVKNYAGLLSFNDKQKAAADVDKNKVVNLIDAMKIQRYDVGLSDSLN